MERPTCACGKRLVEVDRGKFRTQCYRCRRPHLRLDSEARRRKKGIYAFGEKVCCERCGFVPEHPCQMDIDHKDGNHLNDSKTNRQVLCANCHRLKTFQNRDWDRAA